MEDVLLAIEINPEVKKEFKIWCLNNNTDMKEVLTQFIKNTLEK